MGLFKYNMNEICAKTPFLSIVIVLLAYYAVCNILLASKTFSATVTAVVASATIFSVLNTVAAAIGVLFADPHYVTADEPKAAFACEICEIMRAATTHHCSRCGRCVSKLDHHCNAMQTCVAHGNMCYFAKMLVWAFFAAIEQLILAFAVMMCASNKCADLRDYALFQMIAAAGVGVLMPIIMYMLCFDYICRDESQIDTLRHKAAKTSAANSMRANLGPLWLFPMLIPGLPFRIQRIA